MNEKFDTIFCTGELPSDDAIGNGPKIGVATLNYYYAYSREERRFLCDA